MNKIKKGRERKRGSANTETAREKISPNARVNCEKKEGK